ncbi:MAG: sigma-70 family RNA polymerase sigma factor [Prosthecobacter sp.]|jgi:RNA polymerase sigma factor (sigma-70 family)|uniref:RNA polymerase sigma factor n=1 Tax=Prosthecobacter sp. TaxID=1965333 RepID=UPI0019DA9E3A|nr:sigma-70 family RNA polymerase sigma factor [Prosthecobacter sp.]MBE2287391.1 sigma-70 family RNA polymerase sigma factor [Prosthecobacter sp.]
MSQPTERSPSLVADDLFRREGARLVASLAAHLGTHRLQLAEDAVQEALVRALQTWPYRGIPDNPAAWLAQAAKNLALDALRREQTWHRKEAQITAEQERWLTRADPADEPHLADDTLRMLFVCFHPQLSIEAQLALALRTVCGMSPAEIGAAFLTSEAAIAKRLVRARQLIRDLRLPFAVPDASELPQRLDGVLAALYLLFNEGYKASSGDRLIREDLCHEAIRLTRLLAEHATTSQPSTKALLALMCLNAARLRARVNVAGEIVRLHHQDRSQWDARLIEEGILALGAASTGEIISSYHVEAGIAACHCLAPDEASTDWTRILSLYDQLLLLKPTPIVAMNRSVALARVRGPQEALKALESIPNRHSLEAQHLYHAIRASFIAKLGQPAEARAAYQRAADLAQCDAEREFLRIQALESRQCFKTS